MIIFEKLEEFLSELEKINDKETPVFLTKSKMISEDLTMTGSLIFQVSYGGDVIQYTYTEHIEPVQMIPKVSMAQLSKVLPPEDITRINTAINAKIEAFNQQLETEFSKGKQVYQAKGFNNVLEATVV